MSRTRKGRIALVTGGAGFVGRHLVPALLADGVRVRVLDNFMTSSRRALDPVRSRIELVTGDIRDVRAVRRAMRGVDAVFHLAAIRSVVKTVEDPFLAHDINATGVLNLLERSCEARVRRFIFTSTSAVYGDALAARQSEGGRLSPISPYGIAKLAAENYVRYYWLERRLPTTAVRIFNVYGPCQNPESRYSLVIPATLERLLRGEAPLIEGTGRQARDFVYIGDVVNALLAAWGRPRTYGEALNLGSGQATSISRLMAELSRLCGYKGRPRFGPQRPGDPERTCADIAKTRLLLDWKPKVGLRDGLRRTVDWYRKEISQ